MKSTWRNCGLSDAGRRLLQSTRVRTGNQKVHVVRHAAEGNDLVHFGLNVEYRLLAVAITVEEDRYTCSTGSKHIVLPPHVAIKTNIHEDTKMSRSSIRYVQILSLNLP
jgi:hypothetical protein